MDRDLASRYIRENYAPDDRLAVGLFDRYTGAISQRIALASQITDPDFQRWLLQKNAQAHDIYISANALRGEATGCARKDIGQIRHLYLDFDENGTAAVERLLSRKDVPEPNYRIDTSPGRCNLVWKVEGFKREEVEQLQQWLARDTAANPAATSSARLLRLPGFYNDKYGRGHIVTVDEGACRLYHPEDFYERVWSQESAVRRGRNPNTVLKEDRGFAKFLLTRGDSHETVIADLSFERRDDKPDPLRYAELTVRYAEAEIKEEMVRHSAADFLPER